MFHFSFVYAVMEENLETITVSIYPFSKKFFEAQISFQVGTSGKQKIQRAKDIKMFRFAVIT